MSLTNLAANGRRTKTTSAAGGRRFEIILIKPSHYDDDGYVIQWHRSLMPSNTLAVVNGLVGDAAERRVLAPDVDIHVTAVDETNTRIRPDEPIKPIRSAGAGGFIGLVGVQSNQFPRVPAGSRWRSLTPDMGAIGEVVGSSLRR